MDGKGWKRDTQRSCWVCELRMEMERSEEMNVCLLEKRLDV